MKLDGVKCVSCGRAYPPDGSPYRCPVCHGCYDYSVPLVYDSARVEPSQPGIWRFRHAFGLPLDVEAISLGEGHTPLVAESLQGRQLFFKCEFLNPTGSFKDRGSTILISWLKYKGASRAVEDSSGNAGASFAAYAALAGIDAQVFVPETTSGPKRAQMAAYGALVIPVPGSRSQTSEAVIKQAETGVPYASHAYLPFNLPGYATTAYEIFEQLGQLPGSVIVPVGQGGLLLGLQRGFSAICRRKSLKCMPRLAGVQAQACAPLWAFYTAGRAGLDFVAENPTLAEGIRVRFPIRGDAVVNAVRATQGWMVAVEEEKILPGREALARLGFFVEPTSAVVWDALQQIMDVLPEPVVVILTGSGYKVV